MELCVLSLSQFRPIKVLLIILIGLLLHAYTLYLLAHVLPGIMTLSLGVILDTASG